MTERRRSSVPPTALGFIPQPPDDLLSPENIAADHVVTALGPERASLLLAAMRAGWLTPAEAAKLEPLAVAIARMADVDLPEHRGSESSGSRRRQALSDDEVASEVAEQIRLEAALRGVNPHVLIDKAKGYVTVPRGDAVN